MYNAYWYHLIHAIFTTHTASTPHHLLLSALLPDTTHSSSPNRSLISSSVFKLLLMSNDEVVEGIITTMGYIQIVVTHTEAMDIAYR